MSWCALAGFVRLARHTTRSPVVPALLIAAAIACAPRPAARPQSPARADSAQTFRITPVRPVAELRAAALAAAPPRETGDFRAPELVEVRALDPSIRYDIRYATTDNFMGARFYPSAHAFLQRAAAEALVRAHQALARDGLGIIVYDAYRPWHVTKMFWDATPDSLRDFVADPATGSRHNRGAAVDVGLFERATGRILPMPSGYDEFTVRAHVGYDGGTSEQRRNRERLRRALEAQGFTVLRNEWWHFDFAGWRNWPILNLRFEEIRPGDAR